MWRMHSRHTWGIILISAASLAYEITLTRLFAVQQFYHFAFVVIGIATMGFAASGLFLSARRSQPRAFVLALAFSLSTLVAYITINTLPFDSYSIAWDARQWWILLIYFTLSGAPFLTAGWTIGLALDIAGTEAYQPYAANMIGAAIGCPLALISVDLLGGEGAIGLVIAMGLLASLVFEGPSRRFALTAAPAATLALILFSVPVQPFQLNLSPYKPLSTAQLAQGAKHTVMEWGFRTRLDVIERPGLHSFPGLSLNVNADLPEQAGVYLDGEGPLTITRLTPEDPSTAAIRDHLPASLAYTLRSPDEALILDWGAGTPALFALSLPDLAVSIPNTQPLLTSLLDEQYLEYSFYLTRHPDLHVIDRSARSVIADRSKSYAVIEYALSDVYRPVSSGAFSLGENYLLTVESFFDAWNRLDSDGVLVITRWIGTPPSDSARAWNTLLQALRLAGIEDIRPHVIAYRGMRTATMMASPTPFSQRELETTRQFLERNAFDALVLPGLAPSEVNRFNRLPEPVYYALFNELIDDPSTAADYTFRLDPPRDSRPYFNHFFRWSQTREVLASLGLFWQPFGGSGYFVLLVLMALMLLLAGVLIGLSSLLGRRSRSQSRPGTKAFIYFAGLGSGYLLVEIPLIQQFALLLDHPPEALAGVLFILLFGSGVGSWLSMRVPLRTALLALLAYLGVLLVLAPNMIAELLPTSMAIRWLATTLMLTPLGIALGIPFGVGLRRLEQHSPGWIPWAWAVNGAFSGISGVAAAMISLDGGFQITMISGAAAYLLAFTTSTFQPHSSRELKL